VPGADWHRSLGKRAAVRLPDACDRALAPEWRLRLQFQVRDDQRDHRLPHMRNARARRRLTGLRATQCRLAQRPPTASIASPSIKSCGLTQFTL